MQKTILQFLCGLFLFSTAVVQAQSISSVIIDSATQKPIPYVTVQLKNKGIITNEEGRFSFKLNKTIVPTDSLTISCIGYASIKKPLNEFTEDVIKLSPRAIELNPVIVTNKNYTAEEILERVEDGIAKNYHTDFAKKRVFLRVTTTNRVLKTDYVLKKSTIDAFNKPFIDSMLRKLPRSSTYYSEVLGDLYGNEEKKKQKLNLIKASEMYDKSLEFDFEETEARLNAIVKKNIKTDSYFKIKSGLFGTKVEGDEIFEKEVDSSDVMALQKKLKEEQEQKANRKKSFAKHKRESMGKLYHSLPIFEETDYNVIFKPGRYRLSLDSFTYIGDEAVYVISFTPKRSEDFQGKIYINSDDFAVIRMDFENVKPLRNFKLLGVSITEYLSKGRLIFTKGEDSKYQLSYYDITKASRVGFKRPIKIIEKNKNVKGPRKQNELFAKVDAAFGNTDRYELVVFNETPIPSSTFESVTEDNTVLPTYMPNYDPEFWQGHDIIEPNQAIREFTSEVMAE